MSKLFLVMVFIFSAVALAMADDGATRLKYFPTEFGYTPPDRFVTTGGIKFGSGQNLSLAPEFGLEYGSRRFDQSGGTDLVLRNVHAQAGGKLNLLDSLYLSAAAKVPLFRAENTDPRSSGPPLAISFSRRDYDFLRMPGSNLSFGGEMGLHLGLGADLTIYYDQSLLNLPQGGGMQNRPEDQFGTRLIFRFR